MADRNTFWKLFLSLYICAFSILFIKRILVGFDPKHMVVTLLLSVSSLLIIRQFTLRKTMIFAGFHLGIERTFLRAFFLAFALYMIASVFVILIYP